MPTSVRLEPETERLLERLAKKKSQTKSEVIREAIETLAERESKSDQKKGSYERIEDLVGCVSGGPKDLSSETGRKFKDAVKRSHEQRS
jgi:Arc/MetJ-type ribon-helix-helix transcriptional regulator